MSFIRVMLKGTLPGGEAWSVNPCYGETLNVATWNQTNGDNAAEAIGALEIPQPLRSLKSQAALPSTVRVERRSDDNELIGAAERAWAPPTSPVVTPRMSYQTSAVISLRSGTPGRSGRGRLYWPAIGAQLDTASLRLSVPTASDAASAARSYLLAIQNALTANLDPAPSTGVFHALNVYSPTHGTRVQVNRLEVGDILDVQRRRRDRTVENYASVTY